MSRGAEPEESVTGTGDAEPSHRHFRLSPPRHFVYPAILLLLSEKPRHGYTLMEPLLGLGFGPVDRPTVYRALADLEHDGLLRSWSAEPKAGTTRHVYAPTDEGRRALEDWMAILGGERDRIDMVLERYAASTYGRSAPSPSEAPITWPPPRRPTAVGDRQPRPQAVNGPAAAAESAESFTVVAGRSAVLVRARSNVGPIEFGSTSIEGSVRARVDGTRVALGGDVAGELRVPIESLTSGNSLFDSELLRRVDARTFPSATITLDEAEALGSEDRFGVRARMTFHGVTRMLWGVVGVAVRGCDRIVASGEQVIDIRDFDLRAPKVLKLRIYPDVRVYLHLEARAG